MNKWVFPVILLAFALVLNGISDIGNTDRIEKLEQAVIELQAKKDE